METSLRSHCLHPAGGSIGLMQLSAHRSRSLSTAPKFSKLDPNGECAGRLDGRSQSRRLGKRWIGDARRYRIDRRRCKCRWENLSVTPKMTPRGPAVGGGSITSGQPSRGARRNIITISTAPWRSSTVPGQDAGKSVWAFEDGPTEEEERLGGRRPSDSAKNAMRRV